MRLFCKFGFHRWSCYSHRLGQPWRFNMHCLRCGKQKTNSYWLPPQPPSRPREMPHPDFNRMDG